MIQKLKNWFSKQAKKSVPDTNGEELVAFFNITIDAEDNLVFTSDFKDGHEDAMSHLVFLLCSGTLMDLVGNLVEKRCGDDTEKRDLILSQAYKLIMEHMSTSMSDEEEDDDDDDPVVDPCNVFSPKMRDETSEGDD